jgi:hypothetical protein
MCRLIRRSAPAFDVKLFFARLPTARYVRRAGGGAANFPNKSGDNFTREVVAALLLN